MLEEIEPFDSLAEMLKEKGYEHFYHQLNTLLHQTVWTTGSELYGEMGLVLKRFSSECHRKLNDDLAEKLNECLKEVEKIWPQIMEQE
jgi:hypothetical protein